MLRVLSAVNAVIYVALSLLLVASHGAVAGRIGLPPPLPFYATVLAVFLLAAGAGFIPAVADPAHQRTHLWVFGVGVRLAGAVLFIRIWLLGVAGWLVGLGGIADLALALLMAGALLRRRA